MSLNNVNTKISSLLGEGSPVVVKANHKLMAEALRDFIQEAIVMIEGLSEDKFERSDVDTDPTLAGNSDTKVPSQKATLALVTAKIAALVNSSPAALDTLNELATALGNDPSFATTMVNALANKASIDLTNVEDSKVLTRLIADLAVTKQKLASALQGELDAKMQNSVGRLITLGANHNFPVVFDNPEGNYIVNITAQPHYYPEILKEEGVFVARQYTCMRIGDNSLIPAIIMQSGANIYLVDNSGTGVKFSSKSELLTYLANYYTKTEADNRFATKAPINNPTFTGAVGGVTKAMVGLGNVPNVDATNPANIAQSANYRFATDAEKTVWNGKQAALGFTPEDGAKKNAANGYAGLDPEGKIALNLLPSYAYIYTYGIERDTTVATTDCKRIGSSDLHKSLPIQSNMKACLLLDNGTVNYYLNPADWTKKADGTASNLDGTDGQVMVEIPSHYRRFESVGTKKRCLLSEYAVPGFELVPKWYISAFEASLQRSNSKMCSVINLTADFRGGDNTSAWDADERTLLGKAVTNLTRTQCRTYARNRGSVNWNCLTYEAYNSLFWLYYVEYANTNCQLAVNAALTVDGYRQGGLGNGVTDLDSTKWSTFNGNNPVVPCGQSNSLGNLSGEVSYSMPALYDATIKTVKVNRYRGIENPFGHIWKWTDGANVEVQAVDSGALSKLWIANSPADYSDAGYTNHVYKGNLSRTESYVKELILGTCVPETVGGGSTTYWSDYNYTNIPSTGIALRGLLFGGRASFGAFAGFAFVISFHAPSDAYAHFGSRLCFKGV